MKIDDVIKKLNYYREKGCKGNIAISNNNDDEVYMLDDISYMYDIIEAGTKGIVIKAIPVEEYIQKQNIDYGTVLKAYITSNYEADTVMLINNITAGRGLDCLVLDLDTKEILADCENIEEFKERFKIVKILGNFDDLFSY